MPAGITECFQVWPKVAHLVSRDILPWHLPQEGPSEEEVAVASFKMWFVGRGYSDSKTISPGKEPDK